MVTAHGGHRRPGAHGPLVGTTLRPYFYGTEKTRGFTGSVFEGAEFFYFFIIYFMIFQKNIFLKFFCRSDLLSPVQPAERTSSGGRCTVATLQPAEFSSPVQSIFKKL